VADRRHQGAYGPGFEDQLDAHGRAMVAARSGPGRHRALPRPDRPDRRWRRLLSRGGRANPDDAGSERPLNLLFVVQRYGSEVTGGAELACREYATRLAAAGHRVEVLTSRAQSANDWADVYPPGTSELDGVTVHRLGVPAPRDNGAFQSLTVKALWSGSLGPRAEQQEWRQLQGPDLPELQPWLDHRAGEFDVVVHFSYLYTPTWAGLPVSSAVAPTVLHATAHDEPAFWLPVFDDLFPLPTRYAWFSPEERDLLVRRGAPSLGAVVGIGVDLDTDGHPDRFRATTQLGDRPYVVFVGRVEAGKGSEELIQFFEAYKSRHPEPLALVFVGPAEDRHPHPDIIYTGYVDDQTRTDAIAGAVALVQPSFFESFSLVLTEAWAQQRPVLAQGYTDVLVGQVHRSGGGLYYRGFAEFEASLELLLTRPDEADAMGRAGRDFVAREYRWDVVLARYEELLRQAVAHGHSPN
jgi:glycosyltransferase involved in cell wall biosynthesis